MGMDKNGVSKMDCKHNSEGGLIRIEKNFLNTTQKRKEICMGNVLTEKRILATGWVKH